MAVMRMITAMPLTAMITDTHMAMTTSMITAAITTTITGIITATSTIEAR
jgi:hypothetical protein